MPRYPVTDVDCPSCDQPVYSDTGSVFVTRDECSWGPNTCDTCGGCICDLSC